MLLLSNPPLMPKRGEPMWELAKVFPAQGDWTEEDYLEFDRAQNIMMELTDGYLEILPRPTKEHQEILLFMVMALNAFAKPQRLGKAYIAPLPMKLRSGLWREPDVLFVLRENLNDDEYLDHADLVVEIVSPDKRSQVRDYKEKRIDYAKIGIPEYWIVDPKKSQITVLKLERGRYVELGVFKKGAKATSALLKGFSVDVTKALSAE